ncbi:unnamed protein product [Amoebophrya sp. A120]|nr:unnamed protein product [Amoebophrya sp. A120]|eukprot:GSA120T00006027001.1
MTTSFSSSNASALSALLVPASAAVGFFLGAYYAKAGGIGSTKTNNSPTNEEEEKQNEGKSAPSNSGESTSTSASTPGGTSSTSSSSNKLKKTASFQPTADRNVALAADEPELVRGRTLSDTPSVPSISALSRKPSSVAAMDMLNRLDEQTATAINAFEMTEEKNREHSFLLYSLYGIYFYPGYLYNRFSERKNHVVKLQLLAELLGRKYLEAQKYIVEVQDRETLLESYRSPNTSKWLKYEAKDILDTRLLYTLKKLKRKMYGTAAEGVDLVNNNGAGVKQELQPVPPVSPNSSPLQRTASTGSDYNQTKYKPEIVDGTVISEIADEVYRFPTLSKQICDELLVEIELFLEWQEKQIQMKKPGSHLLNTKLCVIDHINHIGPHLLNVLKDAVVDPLMTVLYPAVSQNTTFQGKLLEPVPKLGSTEAKKFTTHEELMQTVQKPTDFRYGFSIGYANRKRETKDSRNISRVGLDCHTDDSEVSLTIRLGKEYSGGAVGLRWKVGDENEGQLQTKIVQKNGEGTLFYGQQFHEVDPVETGERQMLVVWFRGEHGFRTNTCPCCRMNRRFDPNCILCYDNSLKDTGSPLRLSRAGSQELTEADLPPAGMFTAVPYAQ